MIQVSGLTKTFPEGARALAGIDLSINAGEIFALLGPNGAGKTTAIRVLTTLCGFDDGRVAVAGHDIDREPEKVRQAIGYVAQETGVDYFLTGRENLTLQGQLYHMTRADIRARIVELSEYFGIAEHLDKLVSSYSGGMRRKLDIASALIHRPKVLFLDEPTLGLDAPSRQSLWQYVRRLNTDLGLTILLTTHYLDEADKLSHRVAIIDGGQIKVIDTPDALKNAIQGDAVTLELADKGTLNQVRSAVSGLPHVHDTRIEGAMLHVYVANGAAMIPQLLDAARAQHAEIKNISLARPTLDDVFLRHTGASMSRDKESTGQNEWWKQWAGKGGGKWQQQWQQNADSGDLSTDTPGEDWRKWQSQWNNNGNEGGQWPDQNTWAGDANASTPSAPPAPSTPSAWPSSQQWWQPGGDKKSQD